MCGSRTSWYESRSPVTTMTSIPSAAARSASVAMTSSASTPSTSRTGTARVSSTWRISGSCDRNRSGVSFRPALYVASFSLRNVGAAVSKATARWSGFSSPTTLMSIDVKP